MATDSASTAGKLAVNRLPPSLYGVLGVLATGAVLWSLAPDTGSRGETLACLVEWAPALAHGFAMNVLISIGAIFLGTLIGLLAGALAMSKSFAGKLARVWIVAFRNAPWLVLIYFTTYVFPFEIHVFGAAVPFPDWLKVMLGLALPASANIAEVFRGAVSSIPSAQWEAAASLAFSRWQILLKNSRAAMRTPYVAALDERVRHHHHGDRAVITGRHS
jgi:polar amino acid transport system permease protein